MKQRMHAYIGLRATKLIDDLGVAPKLAQFLMFHVARAWDGTWVPDIVIRDMGTGHTYKMESNPRLMGHNVIDVKKMTTDYLQLKKHLGSTSLCLKHVKDEEILNLPYQSHPKKGGELPYRVLALSHTVGDMLKMTDYPLMFYAKKKIPKAYAKNLSAQPIKDLALSAGFTSWQIAKVLYMMSHYIADAHMPLHCDLRDYGSDSRAKAGGGLRRIPRKLHPQIEKMWEKNMPEKDVLMLHKYAKISLDKVINDLPKGSIIKLDTDKAYSLGARIPNISNRENTHMKYVCRVSYALSKKWIKDKTCPYLKSDESVHITNCILHDAVLCTAAMWLKAWKRYAG